MRDKETLRYAGPRSFSADPAGLQRDLQRVAEELDRAFRALAQGVPSRWTFVETARASGALLIDTVTPAQVVSGTIVLSLPVWRPEFVGRSTAVERRLTTGTINVSPVGSNLLNGAAAALTLPAANRLYVITATPVGWASWDDT